MPDTRASAPPGFLRGQEFSLRFIVIFLALVLIVGLAFVIRSRITNATLDSMQWVSHTHEVKATVFELAASLNDMEASAFAAQSDPLSEQAAHRYGGARARYPAGSRAAAVFFVAAI